MQLARVKGEVVATRKEEHLLGQRFRIIQPVDEQDRILAEPLIAVEVVASRTGDLVLWVDAREAPKALPTGYAAVDACIVGIVDSAC
jgi:ethanolamine utilization protein EutN